MPPALCKPFEALTRKRMLYIGAFALLSGYALSGFLADSLVDSYKRQFSNEILDRHGAVIAVKQNDKHLYTRRVTSLPPDFKTLLLQKEDRFFYYHPGVNPVSVARALWARVQGKPSGGASTITQQVAKLLLNHEGQRTLLAKLEELVYAVSLEAHLSKDEILRMYVNSVYVGNQAQGFAQGARVYFGKPLKELSTSESLRLLATLSHPGARNPWKPSNAQAAAALATALDRNEVHFANVPKEHHAYQSTEAFELNTLALTCPSTCQTTLDASLTRRVRAILARVIAQESKRGVRHGAVVVIKVPENELLVLVGSPDPSSFAPGGRINMALEPRPIGSTIKPFIYLKGFQRGLRPYSIVEDREYRYPIATGYPLYPKNYDGAYRGEVTLHEALASSLNVPSVKVLEYIGLTAFYDFLEHDLSFVPLQPLESYQYGIALGGLEMDLLTLTHYYTLFANDGVLKPIALLTAGGSTSNLPPQADIVEKRRIAPPAYVRLVNLILNDRLTGVAQFGRKNNLTLTQDNYSVKTGTSRDFHDSWVVGFTPDFVVGVWLGNAQNTALRQVTGQSGAGRVWHDVMELLLTTPYDRDTPLATDGVAEFTINGSLAYGLPGDELPQHRDLLQSGALILHPHNQDTFVADNTHEIPLEASAAVRWFVDGTFIAQGHEATFTPTNPARFEIEARAADGTREIIHVDVVRDEAALER